MAIYMPSQITPDVRSGLGAGTIDATKDMVVSWRINGSSAMTKFSITIYANDANSTQKYTTGELNNGCPAYGTTSTGQIQMFSYTISAATLSGAGITNGNEYKLVIQQWWSANDSVTQSSASVFITRADPTLTVSDIGVEQIVHPQTYTGNPIQFDTQEPTSVQSCVVDIEPVQSGSGDPSPDNVRPISGWTGCNVWGTGKNLFDRSSASFKFAYFLNNTGEETASENYQYTRKYIPVPAGATINFSYNKTTGHSAACTVCEYDENKTFLYRSAAIAGSTTTGDKSGSITLSDATHYVRFSCPFSTSASDEDGKGTKNIQIELGSTATDYEPYAGSSLAIDWTDEVGTVYGGTLDVTTGVLTVDRVLMTKNTADMDNSESYPGWRDVGIKALGYTASGVVLSNINVGKRFSYNCTGINDIVFLSATYYNKTQTEWIALAMDVQIIVPLPTPVTYQLTPEQVNALAGRNVMWTDCDNLTVEVVNQIRVISTRFYTFTGNYSQAQGDALNWFRWQIAFANDTANPFFDSGRITGTMDISAYYDGFFPDTEYAVRLTCQTENGVEEDTGWINFSCVYAVPSTTGGLTATCAPNTDAVRVEWSGIGSYPGTAIGTYSISDDHLLTLPRNSIIYWENGIAKPMSLAAPWSVLWKGTVGNSSADLFTVGENGSNIVLYYDYAGQSVILTQNGTTVATQTGIINSPTITAVLTEDTLYLRVERPGGGLYPSTTLYPSATLYPKSDDIVTITTYTVPVTYTQVNIDFASVGGYQICEFFEIINGEPSADAINAAINDGTYVPGMDGSDYFLADWTNGIDAGTLDIGGDHVIGFAVYRGQEGSPILEKVAETDKEAEEVYDYGAASQQGPYTYYLFPIGEQTYISSPVISESVSPCWWNWTLMECAETSDPNIFSVLAAYRFRLNLETAAMSNNNSPGILQNFTPYPKIQLSPQNYKSSVLSGLIGAVKWTNGQPEYVDTLELRDAIFALSASPNPMFLKSRKGDLIRVKVSSAISMQTSDSTQEQMQYGSIPWVEVGSAKGVSLFALDNKGWTA